MNLPDEFFDIEAPMFVGKRFVHPGCSDGKDRALVVTRTEYGWKWYCHRCCQGGTYTTSSLSPKQYLRWQETSEIKPDNTVEDVVLPPDFSSEIPPDGLTWLYQYGIDNRDILEYKFGYSRTLHRVILPVYKLGELVYFQARTLGRVDRKTNPKYLNVKAAGRKDIYFDPGRSTNDKIVLVEDIISTIKVNRVVDAMGLLYAYIPEDLIMRLKPYYKEIVLWLDRDKWTRMTKKVFRLRQLNVNVRMILSEKDPKFYTEDEIVERIYG